LVAQFSIKPFCFYAQREGEQSSNYCVVFLCK